MYRIYRGAMSGLVAAAVLAAGGAAALTPAEKCESAKLSEAGKYGFCRLKAESKAIKVGGAPDYGKCDAKYDAKWLTIEDNGGGSCPSNGDDASIKAFITQHTDDLASFLAGGLPSLPLGQRVRTGQTLCYSGAGAVVGCAGTGQDGALQKGLPPSFADNGDGTISDSRTGLMWETLSDDGSVHDKDTVYSWSTAISGKVATLNATSFAGYTDWRLPNVNELQSLANYGAVGPAVHAPLHSGCVPACAATACSCTRSATYWTSTTYQSFPASAWHVDFNIGAVGFGNKGNSGSVRAVRGGP